MYEKYEYTNGIAKHLNINYGLTLRWIKKCNLPPKQKQNNKLEDLFCLDSIKTDFNAGLSESDVALKYNLNARKLYKFLRKNKLNYKRISFKPANHEEF